MDGRKKRSGEIVSQLIKHAGDDNDALDDMLSQIICNPRLAHCDVVIAQEHARKAEVQDEIWLVSRLVVSISA